MILTAFPSAAPSAASEMPVFPDVASTRVVLGPIFPSRRARCTMKDTSLSFIDPVGFTVSSFAKSFGPTRIMGVLPTHLINCCALSILPPSNSKDHLQKHIIVLMSKMDNQYLAVELGSHTPGIALPSRQVFSHCVLSPS